MGFVGGGFGGAALGQLSRGPALDFIGNKTIRGLTTSLLSGGASGAGAGAVGGGCEGYMDGGWGGVLAGSMRGAGRGAVVGVAGGALAFGMGKVIDVSREASWGKSRTNYWRQESRQNPKAYSPANVERMRNGLAPQRVNPMSGRSESMELHHGTVPQRSGLPRSITDTRWNLRRVWPDEHRAIDPFRH